MFFGRLGQDMFYRRRFAINRQNRPPSFKQGQSLRAIAAAKVNSVLLKTTETGIESGKGVYEERTRFPALYPSVIALPIGFGRKALFALVHV